MRFRILSFCCGMRVAGYSFLTLKPYSALQKVTLSMILLLVSKFGFAIDPITVSVNLTPPYTPFLHEYTSAGLGKLQVNITCNDSRMQNYPVKLQMFVENVHQGIVMRTGEFAAIPPIYVNGQSTEILMGADLATYFQPTNLTFSGIDRTQYIQTGRIPDGMYRIGFRVVDSRRTDVVLSNFGFSAPGWFLLNEPPMVNLPRNNSIERIADPQHVKLEWFPRHLGSMNSAIAAQYKVEIFPMRVPGINPNHFVLGMQPEFYDIVHTNFYFLSFDKYLLEPGVQYAWRVQAVVDDGITVFQNKGYSEVHVFTYGNPCPVPENVYATITGTEAVSLAWDSDPRHSAYELQFRLKDENNAVWHQKQSFTTNANINDLLSAGKQYECQVKARCGNNKSDYSELLAFHLPENPLTNFQCGLLDEDTSITNKGPKLDLWPDEVIYNGNFPVRLVEVHGGYGTFSGVGRLMVPFLNNIQVLVEFKDIRVNELNQVVYGEMRSIYNPDSKFLINPNDYLLAGNDVGWVKTGLDSAAIRLNSEVEKVSDLTIEYRGNEIIIKNKGNSTSATLASTKGGTTLMDSEGNLYAVDEDKNVTKIGKSGSVQSTSGLPAVNFATSKEKIENLVIFDNDPTDLWAWDTRKEEYSGSSFFDNEYENINGHYVPWKLIPAGKWGKVKAKLNGNLDHPEKVIFRNSKGTEYMSQYKNNTFSINIIGGKSGDAQDLYAIYIEEDSTTRTLGKLSVATYEWLQPKVKLVPVTCTVNETTAKESLDDIYLPYGIDWQVTMDEPFTDTSWDLNNDGLLEIKSSNFVSVYSAEMKALNRHYAQERGLDPNTVYIFYFKEADSKLPNLAGDMPIGYQFGYVFSEGESETIVSKTLAHELGHGAFQLEHTFDEKHNIDQRKSNNLMDYKDGSELIKYQWDAIHDPQKRLLKFMQGDEEGEFIYGITWLGNNLWGLAPDEQERQVEISRALFKNIFKNYDQLFIYSKTKDTNLDIEEFKDWSVRKASHNGIARKIFKGIKEETVSFSLHKEGIYFEEYTLDKKPYKVAVYSKVESVRLNKDIRINSFKNLRNNKSIKVGYTSDYGLIVFYDIDGTMQMVLQIIGGNTAKEAVTQWINYLGLVILSEKQKEDDKETIFQKISNNIQLHSLIKLFEIWDEEDEEKSSIDIALVEMEEYLGNLYAYGGGESRISLEEKGTKEMDCSEFVARFLKKVCELEEVPNPFYTSLMLSTMEDGKLDSLLINVENSEKEDFKDIKPGDIFLWSRSYSDGHTGVVVSYDQETDKVTVIEAIGPNGAAEESLSKDLDGYCQNCIRKSIYTRTGKALYKHAGWKGYFRANPKNNK